MVPWPIVVRIELTEFVKNLIMIGVQMYLKLMSDLRAKFWAIHSNSRPHSIRTQPLYFDRESSKLSYQKFNEGDTSIDRMTESKMNCC